jgi:N-acetylneuraminic acid mutarotase
MRTDEQFQVWVLDGGRWQIIGAFPDFDPANALARARNSRVRLVRAEFENGKATHADILAEIGATRTAH